MIDPIFDDGLAAENLTALRVGDRGAWDKRAPDRIKAVHECCERLRINLFFLPPYAPNLNRGVRERIRCYVTN